MSNNKTLVRFNIQNAKYAIDNGTGYDTPIPLGTSTKLALETNVSEKDIFGDGKIIASIINDKGKTGTITTNNICEEYEVDMGRKMKLSSGIADVNTIKKVNHAIYFETKGVTDNNTFPVAKTWLYGVTSTRPAESYDQTTDDINESSFDTPLKIIGTPLKNAQNEIYKDAEGNTYVVYQLTVVPGDEGYDTFGDAVVEPIAK